MKTQSGEYVPEDNMASVALSPETQAIIEEVNQLDRQGELFIGDTAALRRDKSVEDLLARSIALLVSDLKRHLGAEDAPTSYYDGMILRINLPNQYITWWNAGYFYFGVYDYRTQECSYYGRSRIWPGR